jgi:hypothetical protein
MFLCLILAYVYYAPQTRAYRDTAFRACLCCCLSARFRWRCRSRSRRFFVEFVGIPHLPVTSPASVEAPPLQTSPKFPGSVPFSVKAEGDGLPHKFPRHNALICLFPSSMVSWFSHGHRWLPSGDATQMIPQPTFTENGADPILFTPVRHEADRIGYRHPTDLHTVALPRRQPPQATVRHACSPS